MKTLRLATTPSDAEARRLGLEGKHEFDLVTVDDDVADELIRRRWADTPEPQPRPRGAAPASHREEDEAPNLVAMTRDDLLAHADKHKVPGVGPTMTKDQIIKAIEKAQKPQ